MELQIALQVKDDFVDVRTDSGLTDVGEAQIGSALAAYGEVTSMKIRPPFISAADEKDARTVPEKEADEARAARLEAERIRAERFDADVADLSKDYDPDTNAGEGATPEEQGVDFDADAHPRDEHGRFVSADDAERSPRVDLGADGQDHNPDAPSERG